MGAPLILQFFQSPHQSECPPPIKHLLFKNEALPSEKQILPLKNESPSRKWFLEKNLEKSETDIKTCVSIIKEHWKKMVEIPQECDFFTWNIQNFVKKAKPMFRKYYITWLITQFVVFGIELLTVLFCNTPLFSNCPLTDL